MPRRTQPTSPRGRIYAQLCRPAALHHPTLPLRATQELSVTKARRRGLLVHTGWSGKSQMQWRIVLLFLFFISEPVGMCRSAVELNGSCCSRKTNKSPSAQATSVATFLALSIQKLWKGYRTLGGAPSAASQDPVSWLSLSGFLPSTLTDARPWAAPAQPHLEGGEYRSPRCLVCNSFTAPWASGRQTESYFTLTWCFWGSFPVLIAK